MKSPSRAAITFGVQAGDAQADSAVSTHYLELRRLLARRCNNSYSDVIDEFAPILRIDGEIWSWNKRGCENFRIQKKSRYATFDVFMPVDIWSQGQGSRIRDYLITQLIEGFQTIIKRAEKAGIAIDKAQLNKDLAGVAREFSDNHS
jgi:hypothetical protein